MLIWLQLNFGSVLVALVLLIVVALIIRGLIRDRKAGKHTCGCSCGGCAGCAMNGHSRKT